MSDPIAAAEAAGKARDIANRFETAVFLIAYGIAEKDGLYEADPHRYPYSQAFRHGMNILAALCAECSDDAEELLPTFNESDFIRNSAASDVREWTARWRDECRMLIRHPLLTWNEYVRIKTGLALGDPDPLDQGEADTIDPVWLQEFVSMAYEPVPGAAKVCPNCGWTMTMRGKQPHCSSATCAKAVTGDFDKLDSVAHDAFRLSRGVLREDDQRVLPSVARWRGRGACQRQIRRGPARLHGAALQERYEGEPSRPAPSRRAGRGVYLGLGAHRQTVAIRPRK